MLRLAGDLGMRVPPASAAPVAAQGPAATAKQGGSRKRPAQLSGAAGAKHGRKTCAPPSVEAAGSEEEASAGSLLRRLTASLRGRDPGSTGSTGWMQGLQGRETPTSSEAAGGADRDDVSAAGAAAAAAAAAGRAVFSSDAGAGALGVKLIKKPGVYKSRKELVRADAAPVDEAASLEQLIEREGLGPSSDADFIADDPSVCGELSSCAEMQACCYCACTGHESTTLTCSRQDVARTTCAPPPRTRILVRGRARASALSSTAPYARNPTNSVRQIGMSDAPLAVGGP